jgi:hypothetical protein
MLLLLKSFINKKKKVIIENGINKITRIQPNKLGV